MKKRITVYLDEQVWREFRIRCLNRGESASSEVEKLILGPEVPKPTQKIPPVDIEAENAKLMEKRKNLKTESESLREKYKRTHPVEMCPQCREKNKDCVCGR